MPRRALPKVQADLDEDRTQGGQPFGGGVVDEGAVGEDPQPVLPPPDLPAQVEEVRVQQGLAAGQVDLRLRVPALQQGGELVQAAEQLRPGHMALIVLLIAVGAAQVARVGDVPLEVKPLPAHQSAPPPPQEEQEEQEEQDEPEELEDERLLLSSAAQALE